MVVVKKVKSRMVLPTKEADVQIKKQEVPAKKSTKEPAVEASQAEDGGKRDETSKRPAGSKKYCYFCKTKNKPIYWDTAALRKYVNDRGKIVPRSRLGTCAKHQRCVSREIKHARHLAILPFTSKVR